jgi:hypothetical protein
MRTLERWMNTYTRTYLLFFFGISWAVEVFCLFAGHPILSVLLPMLIFTTAVHFPEGWNLYYRMRTAERLVQEEKTSRKQNSSIYR